MKIQKKTPLNRPPAQQMAKEIDYLNNDNPHTNGELWFYRGIRDRIKSIFDVGAHASLYLDFPGTVHYFEPWSGSNFKQVENDNKKSYFNDFGLSDVSSDARNITWETGDVRPQRDSEPLFAGEDVTMKTKTAAAYMAENQIKSVDFIKIDTEGHELAVLQGFQEYLHHVKIVQFEYGGINWTLDIKMADIITHLQRFGFSQFSYLAPDRLEPIKLTKDFEDHYAYCNVVCFNEKYVTMDK
jgi:FkbM family methyltransferase